MPAISDPDNLSQGALTNVADIVFGTPSGSTVTMTSAGTNFPAITAGMYFEIRNHSIASNNGLYQETGGSPGTGSVTADKVDGVNPVVDASGESADWLGDSGATANEKSVHFDVASSSIWLIDQGNVTTDGVVEQTVYSFSKQEWKTDNFLNAFDFPWVSITPEQFELQGWTLATADTVKRFRTGGLSEIRVSDGAILRQFMGVVTLGTFEDASFDFAKYQLGDDPTDTAAAVAFTFPGPVDEMIQVYELTAGPFPVATEGFAVTAMNVITRGAGSFITDGYKIGGGANIINAEDVGNNSLGTLTLTNVTALVLTFAGTPLTNNADDNTMEIAVDNREAVSLRLRIRDSDPNGKLFDGSDLAAIGQTDVDNKAFRFPLSNATDLKIAETDANVSTISPFTEIRARYLNAAYNREVDSTTKRNFGIIIDVGTYSQSQGVSAISTLFTSASLGLGSGEALADYAGGTLTIHEGTDQGDHVISGTPVDNAGTLEITLTVALTAVATDLSFTVQRATPVAATAEEIFEKTQYLLRQAADIDSTLDIVTGETADLLLNFVGDTLECGRLLPNNPNLVSGGGVFIEGFDANDTNRLTFVDNGGTDRNFPFVAAGNINWNANLENDADGAYWMYFTYTERFTQTDFSTTGPSADTVTLNSATTDLTAELADGDYIAMSGWADDSLNGIFVLTGAPTGAGPWTAPLRRVDGATVVAEGTGATVNVDKNPIGTPDAIQVNNNAGSPITAATFGGGLSDPFDFDYDGNVQGGRTAGTTAEITLKAIGYNTGQYVETTGQILQAVGQVFTLVSALERNYDNP